MTKVPSYDAPRLFADRAHIDQRRSELGQKHIEPLASFAKELRLVGRYGCIPDFDPWDAGVEAQALFLFEKPGRKAFESGFISRNNNDRTAENTFVLMRRANVCRKRTCTWNAIPGWNGTTDLSAEERNTGLSTLPGLLDRLKPSLKVIVLVGREAQRLWRQLPDRPDLPIIPSPHPSPQVQNIQPLVWDHIAIQWSKVRDFIEDGCECGNCERG